jgi:hypothetical protein
MLRRALVSLLFGAAATCVVAAAAAMRSMPRSVPTLAAMPVTATVQITSFRAFGLSATPQPAIDIAPPGGPAPPTAAFTVAAGWPFRAFVATTNPRARAPTGGFSPSELPFPSLASPPVKNPCFVPRVVPYTPLWPGLIGDSVLWGSLGYVALSWVALRRRRARLRRGECPECRYRLVPTSLRCPECGR